MGTNQENKRQKKRIFWQQHLHAWEESRLSQKAYCEANTLSLQSFSYWKRKFGKAKRDQPRFFPLTVPSTPAAAIEIDSGLSLSCHNERFRIVIKDDFSPCLLKKLINTLEQL